MKKKDVIIIQCESDRLVLKNLQEDDVTEAYVNWLNDPEVNRYLTTSGVRQSIEGCKAYVRSFRGNQNATLIGIFEKKNMRHIGNITLSSINWQHHKATIGISIGRKECWKMGYASEAVRRIAQLLFENNQIHRLQAGSAETNLNSIKMFLRCGFRIEGYLRDSNIIQGQYQGGYILGLLSSDKKSN